MNSVDTAHMLVKRSEDRASMLIFVMCGFSSYAYLWILWLCISVVECGFSLFAYLRMWILLLYISVDNVVGAYMPIH